MLVKEKANCTITILDRSELGLNSAPFLKVAPKVKVKQICNEVHNLMTNHGMNREDAEKTHKENMEWAM
jgi:hypothetical protein